MDAIANIMNLFIFVFCILFVNIDKTVVCASVKSIKSLSLSLGHFLDEFQRSRFTSGVLYPKLHVWCNVPPSIFYSKQYLSNILDFGV